MLTTIGVPPDGLFIPRLSLRVLKVEDFLRGLYWDGPGRGPVRARSLRGDGRDLVGGRFEGRGSSEVRRGLSLILYDLGGLVGSERVRGREDSLELVSAVLILYVRTLDGEGERSSGEVVQRAAAVAGTEVVEGSSGRARRTNESTERDFLNFDGERVGVGTTRGPWTSMGGKMGLPSAGIFVVVVLDVVGVVEERVGRNSAAITPP